MMRASLQRDPEPRTFRFVRTLWSEFKKLRAQIVEAIDWCHWRWEQWQDERYLRAYALLDELAAEYDYRDRINALVAECQDNHR